MTPEQVEAHDKPVALLRPLPVRERTTILAQAIHEGTMTRVGADQVLFALALDDKSRSAPVTPAANNLVHRVDAGRDDWHELQQGRFSDRAFGC
jgi:hypothetical protein